jgi:hypothetical protein
VGIYVIVAALFVAGWFEMWRRFADRPGQSEPARLVRTLLLIWGTIVTLVLLATGVAFVVSLGR